MRLIQIFEILLVIAFVVGKQLHANSEKTPVLPFDAPCASLSTVSPSCFRAKGDGVVDDTVAFQKLIDFCSMERCSIDLGLNKYLISSSLFITSPIRIVGGAALGESEHGFQLIAADNFRGNALLFIGQDGVAGVNGVTLQGVGLDCRYFCKRVLSIFGGANVTLRDVKVRRGLGVGIYANGLWVSNWYNLSSRYNRGGGCIYMERLERFQTLEFLGYMPIIIVFFSLSFRERKELRLQIFTVRCWSFRRTIHLC